MISPSQCPKCGGSNTTLLFNGYICNVCEPVKVAKVEAPKPLEPIKFYYGWILSTNWSYDDRAQLEGKWGTAYATHMEARKARDASGCMYILRIKTNVPVQTRDRFRLVTARYLDRIDGQLYQPKDLGWGDVSEKGFCAVVPEDEGL